MAAPELGPGGELVEAGMDLSDTYFSEYVPRPPGEVGVA